MLGFLVPFSVRGKMIMEQIRQSQGQQWDKPIEESMQKSFNTWRSELPQDDPAISRLYKTNSDDNKESHVFGDASKDAFCAVAYVASAGANDRHVNVTMGKAPVAPMKHHILP